MKKLADILTAAVLFLLFSAGAGEARAAEPDRSLDEIKAVLEKIPGHRAEADYSFKLMQGGTAVNCAGHAVVQDNMFHISGNGMEIYCNGKTIIYLDPEKKEAYIEDAIRLEEYIKGNIASIREFKTSLFRIHDISGDCSEFEAPKFDGSWVVTDLR